jgi:hypothetical protein
MLVRCLDNSLHSDQLTVGKQYELKSRDRDNFRLVGIRGLFHYKRFASLPYVEKSRQLGMTAILPSVVSSRIGDASFPEPIKRYRGKLDDR